MRSVVFAAIFVWMTCAIGERAESQSDRPDPSTLPAVRVDKAFGSDRTESEASEFASALEPENKPATLAILSEEELTELLGYRLGGGMGGTFRQFGNMFLVTSRLNIGTAIGLMSESNKIIKAELRSPFPESYSPTLREFLDAIALQTGSEWKYEATGKYFQSSVKAAQPIKDVAIFEFTKSKREKPFQITLAEGWETHDKGNWVMYVPTKFPVGMDIYEMGTYSTRDQAGEKKFYDEIRLSVALEWANRVNPGAVKEDLKQAKVGDYDALSYEALLKGQDKKAIRWRQWVFMVGNKCYFVVSTILPPLDEEIFPDVQRMLETFKVKE